MVIVIYTGILAIIEDQSAFTVPCYVNASVAHLWKQLEKQDNFNSDQTFDHPALFIEGTPYYSSWLTQKN